MTTQNPSFKKFTDGFPERPTSLAILPTLNNEVDGVSIHRCLDCLLSSAVKEYIKAPCHWSLWGEWPVDSPHNRPVMGNVFPSDDIIMSPVIVSCCLHQERCNEMNTMNGHTFIILNDSLNGKFYETSMMPNMEVSEDFHRVTWDELLPGASFIISFIISPGTKWPPFRRRHFQMHWMKSLVFWFEFHWSLFLRVQLTIREHWFR